MLEYKFVGGEWHIGSYKHLLPEHVCDALCLIRLDSVVAFFSMSRLRRHEKPVLKNVECARLSQKPVGHVQD